VYTSIARDVPPNCGSSVILSDFISTLQQLVTKFRMLFMLNKLILLYYKMLQKLVVENLKTWAEFLIITLIFRKWKFNVVLMLHYSSILYFLFP
jgi:hypothetical protein